jgi:hypothetical protein
VPSRLRPARAGRITNSSSSSVHAAAALRRRRGQREGGCAGLHAFVKRGDGEKARLTGEDFAELLHWQRAALLSAARDGSAW